jgi:hypothetical protein
MRSLLLALLVPSLCFADIAVSPVSIDKAVSATDNTLEWVVANPSDQPVDVTLSTGPLTHDLEGRPQAGKAGWAYDASGLIHFDQPAFTLAPRRWKRVRAHVDVPGRQGGGYAFVYVRGMPSHADARGITSALRVGVVVELTFPDAGKPALRVEGLTSGSDGLGVTVRNDGPAHVHPAGTVAIKDRAGNTVWSAPVVPANIFPGLSRTLKLTAVPALPSGDYRAEVALTSPARASLTEAVAVRDGKLHAGEATAKVSQR